MKNRWRGRLRGLYAVTPEMADTARLVALVDECLAGGAALVQYRAKNLVPAVAHAQARALAATCHAHGALLIVNDSVDLALAVGADGVHLGRDDGDIRKARAALPGKIIGVSCYADPQLARAARDAGADYVGIGSVFASSTKPNAVRAPLESLAAAKGVSGLPVAAIGGITGANAAAAIAAGADMLAVIAAIFDAADARAATRQLADLFDPPANPIANARTQPRAV